MNELPPFPGEDDEENVPARHDDLDTSHQAARSNPVFRRGQKWLLLKAHVEAFAANPELYDGMTADEAWIRAGGTVPSSSCYWHRHGDLDNIHGLLSRAIDPRTGEVIKRRGVAGEAQVVRKLAQEGWDYYWSVAGSEEL
jgi:hypothetical protein